MEFKGIDWTELSVCFGIIDKVEDWQDDTEILNKTKDYLQSMLLNEHKQDEVAHPLRLFLQKLYDNSLKHKSNAPIWKGLLEVEDNFTFIKYSVILFEHMWY